MRNGDVVELLTQIHGWSDSWLACLSAWAIELVLDALLYFHVRVMCSQVLGSRGERKSFRPFVLENFLKST